MSAHISRAWLSLVLVIGPASVPVAAGMFEEGRDKAVQCVACHGADGVAPNPTFPHLAGQNAAYLSIQLERFRSGERYHPLMTPVAQALSDQDIGDLAVYYSAIRSWIEARSEP